MLACDETLKCAFHSAAAVASTSNQEVFKASLGGRLVVDVLRQVLTSHPLGTFTLADAVLSLLGQTMEVLPPAALAALCAGQHGGRPRLHRYALRRAQLVGELMSKLETVTDAVEMSRTCGLTLPIVSYQAQMVRTHQLLLRAGRRAGVVIGGRLDASPLASSPFLIHPVEQRTAGLYRDPVAVLDFASLYPSLFRAHNLCYSTLVHPSDAPGAPGARLIEADVFRAPTGAIFVRSHVRAGLFPALLHSLLQARTLAREARAREADPKRAARLELRQRSLKLVANAAYGFTGAGASPLQSLQLADACLALGAQACRDAIGVLERAPELAGARVVYAQTDSLFVHFPATSEEDALRQAARAAEIVSAAFPPEMSVKLERVMRPFLLLHVNRYAGCEFSQAGERGALHVKGIKSAWRQSAPFLRRLLLRCLELMLVEQDVDSAKAHACAEVRRLLTGQTDLGELVMSGGLWRITSKEIAAAAEADQADVTGPHAALAVRLAARDPGRVRVLGERVPYVLLAGFKKQDDAASDPVDALHMCAPPATDLYWTNKVRTPLEEIFAPVLEPEQLRDLLAGPHTRVKAAAPLREGAGGAAPRGLGGFFAPRARCLGCRQVPAGPPPPPLCAECDAQPGREQEVLLRTLDAANAAEQRKAAGDAKCMRCHSGGGMHEILCANGDCPVLFARGKACADAAEARDALARFAPDW
jgi:DNA polymerase delta subunit 1